jgi:hypothetical protein
MDFLAVDFEPQTQTTDRLLMTPPHREGLFVRFPTPQDGIAS